MLWRPLWVIFLCSVGWSWYFASEYGASKKCGNDVPGEEVYVSIYLSPRSFGKTNQNFGDDIYFVK